MESLVCSGQLSKNKKIKIKWQLGFITIILKLLTCSLKFTQKVTSFYINIIFALISFQKFFNLIFSLNKCKR